MCRDRDVEIDTVVGSWQHKQTPPQQTIAASERFTCARAWWAV